MRLRRCPRGAGRRGGASRSRKTMGKPWENHGKWRCFSENQLVDV
jgi:hypothetical protein